MPGPANSKKKIRTQTKRNKQRSSGNQFKPNGVSATRHTEPTQCPMGDNDVLEDDHSTSKFQSSEHDAQIPHFSLIYDPDMPVTHPTPLIQQIEESISYEVRTTISIPTGSPLIPPTKGLTKTVERLLVQEPFIQDPGNGPRVRDTRAFMKSFFAQPPAWDDPMCAEFAQAEILQMLKTVLPEDMALVLWYNKSRSQSRVCPACQRLYNIMDILKSHVDDTPDNELTPQLLRERIISGLCSPMCFILACFEFPGAIKSAWGAISDEIDETSWELLNRASIPPNPGQATAAIFTSRALGLLVRMTRMHDLGLAQLCFEPEDTDLLYSAQDSDASELGGSAGPHVVDDRILPPIPASVPVVEDANILELTQESEGVEVDDAGRGVVENVVVEASEVER